MRDDTVEDKRTPQYLFLEQIELQEKFFLICLLNWPTLAAIARKPHNDEWRSDPKKGSIGLVSLDRLKTMSAKLGKREVLWTLFDVAEGFLQNAARFNDYLLVNADYLEQRFAGPLERFGVNDNKESLKGFILPARKAGKGLKKRPAPKLPMLWGKFKCRAFRVCGSKKTHVHTHT